MTKNRSIKIAVLVLALALITSCFVGTTFAKYTSTATGTASVEIAKWAVKVGGTNLATYTNDVPFNLFDTINDTKDSNDEEDVRDDMIAPGTKGAFSFTVENDSDVVATISVAISKTSGPDVPIAWTLGGVACTNLDDLNTKIAAALADAGEIDADAVTLEIGWSWAYEIAENASDVSDTAIGVTGGTLAYLATITATQVD